MAVRNLVVSRLVWVRSVSRKPNIYNAISNQLTIEWETVAHWAT